MKKISYSDKEEGYKIDLPLFINLKSQYHIPIQKEYFDAFFHISY